MKRKFTDLVSMVGTTPARFSGEKRYISTGAVDQFSIDEAAVEMVTYTNRPSRANLTAQKGDVLFAKMAETLKTLCLDDELANNIYSTGFCAIRAREQVIMPQCLYYLVSSPTFLSQKDQNASGATQRAITNAGLANIYVNVPTLEEQEKAIKTLDFVSSLIAKRKTQLAAIDDLVKSQFIEMFKDIPQEDFVPLSELCKIITDGTHQPPKFCGEGIPFLFVSNIANNEIDYATEKFISRETYLELIKRTPIEVGDILLSTVGSYGHPAVVTDDREFCFQRHIAYLKPRHDLIESRFLYGALLSPIGQEQIERGVKGIAQKTLNLSEVRKIKIPAPVLERQKLYSAFCQQTDKSKVLILKNKILINRLVRVA